MDVLVHAPQIDWQIDEGMDFLLPKMKTDVALEYGNRILIIDAKFHSQNVSIHHSSNLYQIFTYVKNKALELEGKDMGVIGMLLYARTNEIIQPDSEYVMSGNRISVKTLDLNQEFNIFREQLDGIVEDNLLQ